MKKMIERITPFVDHVIRGVIEDSGKSVGPHDLWSAKDVETVAVGIVRIVLREMQAPTEEMIDAANQFLEADYPIEDVFEAAIVAALKEST